MVNMGATAAGGWERMAVWLLLAVVHIPHATAFGIPKFLEFGDCADIKVDPDLNYERYSGIWFNMENVPNEYTEVTACSMTNYTWTGNLMTVVERGLTSEGRKVRQRSVMRPTEGEPGVLTVDAEGVPSAPYAIVATDYDNYACVHSCMSFMGFRAAFSWVFTRVPNPDHSYLALCRDVMADSGIDPSAMHPVKQDKDCPYTEKLDSLLAYSHGVQSKARAKAMAENKSKATTAREETAQVVPRVEIESTQHTTATHSSPDRETIETFIQQEEKHLRELEHELEEEERQLMHTLEEERRQEEEEIQEIRDEVIHESRRHHRGGNRDRDHQGTVTAGGDYLRQNSVMLLLSALISMLVSSSV